MVSIVGKVAKKLVHSYDLGKLQNSTATLDNHVADLKMLNIVFSVIIASDFTAGYSSKRNENTSMFTN